MSPFISMSTGHVWAVLILHLIHFSTQQKNTTENCESFTLRLHRTLPLSQRLDHCGCQQSRSTASHFLWWWWWGRHAAGQGPGGFAIYLAVSFLCFFCLVLLVGEAELPGGYKKGKCSAAGLAVYHVLWDTLTSAVASYKRSTFWFMPLLWAAVKICCWATRSLCARKKKAIDIDRLQNTGVDITSRWSQIWTQFKKRGSGSVCLKAGHPLFSLSPNRSAMGSWCSDLHPQATAPAVRQCCHRLRAQQEQRPAWSSLLRRDPHEGKRVSRLTSGILYS